MNLSELGLNRWGYKVVQKTETSNSSEMSSDSYLYKSQTDINKKSEGESDVQTGTVIKNVIIDYVPSVTTSVLGFLLPNGIASGYFMPISPQALSLIIDETEIPFGPGRIGDSVSKVTLYGSVVACPLPTVTNALDIIRKIPEPSYVGERGHFGKRLYFDDETFPTEGLLEIEGKQEIEHTMMIGLLMKAVVELTTKVDNLEKEIALIKN